MFNMFLICMLANIHANRMVFTNFMWFTLYSPKEGDVHHFSATIGNFTLRGRGRPSYI